jgi:hypothetical protein
MTLFSTKITGPSPGKRKDPVSFLKKFESALPVLAWLLPF